MVLRDSWEEVHSQTCAMLCLQITMITATLITIVEYYFEKHSFFLLGEGNPSLCPRCMECDDLWDGMGACKYDNGFLIISHRCRWDRLIRANKHLLDKTLKPLNSLIPLVRLCFIACFVAYWQGPVAMVTSHMDIAISLLIRPCSDHLLLDVSWLNKQWVCEMVIIKYN